MRNRVKFNAEPDSVLAFQKEGRIAEINLDYVYATALPQPTTYFSDVNEPDHPESNGHLKWKDRTFPKIL